MIDTCQANSMYSQFYSPNILATGSSEIEENSYSVCHSSTPFLPSLIVNSTKTTTTLASPSSTVIPTSYSNSWKASTRPARSPCRTWYARPSQRHAVRRAHTLTVFILRSNCDSFTCWRAFRSLPTATRQDTHHGLFRRCRTG